MSALVQFGSRSAILRAGIWVSADGGLERELNDYTVSWFRQAGGPSTGEANQELAVAREIALKFGGRVRLRLRGSSGESERRFLSLRQMAFDFSAPPIPVNRRGSAKPRAQ